MKKIFRTSLAILLISVAVGSTALATPSVNQLKEDKKKAQKIWDEYQSLILEQCPVIYLIRSQSFYAIRNRWDLTNMYFDNMGGANTNNLFLKEEL